MQLKEDLREGLGKQSAHHLIIFDNAASALLVMLSRNGLSVIRLLTHTDCQNFVNFFCGTYAGEMEGVWNGALLMLNM